ncbi:MAG: hypothetical protein WCN92_13075, partial [Eubacteriales bacterium]
IIFSLRPFMVKMSTAIQQVIIMVVYIAIGMTTITNGISQVEKNASLKLITDTVKTAQIKAILDSASSGVTVWLRVCMVFIPILFMTAAYIFMLKKVKIDEVKYEEILSKIEVRKGVAKEEKGDS